MGGLPKVQTILTAQGAAVDGAPLRVGELDDATFHVSGIVAGDVVRIEGSNEDSPPTVWVALEFEGSADLTANKIYSLEALPNWIRARLTAFAGGGSVNVFMRAGR